MRETPKEVLTSAEGEFDPDRRVLKMLGARIKVPVLRQPDGNKEEAHGIAMGF
jgi:hypothetical protein